MEILFLILWCAAGVRAWFIVMRGSTEVSVGDLLGLFPYMLFGVPLFIVLTASDYSEVIIWRRK